MQKTVETGDAAGSYGGHNETQNPEIETMLARRAGLLDWDRHSIRWAMVALALAVLIGAVAQRTSGERMQASDHVPSAVVPA